MVNSDRHIDDNGNNKSFLLFISWLCAPLYLQDLLGVVCLVADLSSVE